MGDAGPDSPRGGSGRARFPVAVETVARGDVGPTHNPSLSPFLTVVGLVFGALLGFTVVVAWEQFSWPRPTSLMRRRRSRRCTGRPSRCRIPSGHSCASSFASTLRRYRVRNGLLKKPAVAPATRQGPPSPRCIASSAIGPPARRVQSMESFSSKLSVLTTDRDQRVLDQEPRIPTLLWAGLIFGGGLLIAIAGFVNFSSRRGHAALASGVAVLMGLLSVRRLLARPSIWNGNRRHAGTVSSRR